MSGKIHWRQHRGQKCGGHTGIGPIFTPIYATLAISCTQIWQGKNALKVWRGHIFQENPNITDPWLKRSKDFTIETKPPDPLEPNWDTAPIFDIKLNRSKGKWTALFFLGYSPKGSFIKSIFTIGFYFSFWLAMCSSYTMFMPVVGFHSEMRKVHLPVFSNLIEQIELDPVELSRLNWKETA